MGHLHKNIATYTNPREQFVRRGLAVARFY